MSPSEVPAVAPLATAVLGLLAAPTEALTVGQLQAQIVTVTPLLDRLDGWLRAREGQLHALTGGQLPAEEGTSRSVAGWLAEVRTDSSAAAGSRLRTSSLLREHLPLVADAVVEGILTPAQAQVLTRLIGKIDDDGLRESQPGLIAVAAELTPAALAAWVADKIATFCEPALEADERSGQDRRYLQTRREADGMLSGSFRLSREDSEAVLTVLEPLARRSGLTDTRSAGQRRADALVTVFVGAARWAELGDAGGQRPQLTYLLPADWAAQQRERDTCTACGPRCSDHAPVEFAAAVDADRPGVSGASAAGGCARAAWSGPQTRARIEALLCEARISRVLLDSSGQVQRLESLHDEITASQRRAVAARDGGCTRRSCTVPPAFCDVHHLWHREHGGPTSVDNLVLVCRRDHVLWHLGKIGYKDLRIPWHPRQRGHPEAA